MYELLIWSRFANRVYLDLTASGEGLVLRSGATAKDERIKKGSVSEQNPSVPRTRDTSPSQGSKITDFDTLFEVLESIAWDQYLTGEEYIVIEASSTRSILTSIPTIQSVAQKAIFSKLYTPDNTNGVEVHILILIIDDIAHILLDITGNPLHKRGYREEAGEAPIKENLAAALVAFANWKYREPLLDPFCGSGTIPIEAAMIARNIAPGMNRHFRIEELPFYNRAFFQEAKEQAKAKIYPSGKYQIFGSDIDASMIEMAKRNAERAWVSEDITFSVWDFLQHTNKPINQYTIISNPPYGNRLQQTDLETIYEKLTKEIRENNWGFITSFSLRDTKNLANKKLFNGSEECRFWYKKGL
jgi:putative N6-adenine-specific DNA methylase